MQVVQTAEVPPNHGRIILAMTGWTSKRRKADSEMVRAYRSMARVSCNDRTRPVICGARTLACRVHTRVNTRSLFTVFT